MNTFWFVLAATVFEAVGDAVIRLALGQARTPARLLFFVVGGVLLTAYGTSLNLAPVEFAAVTGFYIAMLFVMFQVTNFLIFRTVPSVGTLVGGVLIVAGGLIVGLWRQ